ncbi:hypothetical protein [Caudoviricetes sp.]|nr:hypothetical protein [Caudoviricetes sp.]
MPWAAAAIVVSALIAKNSSDKAADKAAGVGNKASDFEKKKYEDWQNVYGSIQSNLADYYSKMTPDTYAAKGIDAFNKQNELVLENTKTMLAQKGLTDSGIGEAINLQLDLQGAEKKATIRSTAADAVAAEKGRFLQIGLGQNPGQSYSQLLQNQATQANTASLLADKQTGQAISTAITEVGKAYQDYSRENTTAAPVVESQVTPRSN